MISPELDQSLITIHAFKVIEDFRRWLVLRPEYLQALSASLFQGENLKRPDKSIRFQYKNYSYDVIDEFIREDTQLFTIRKRDANLEIRDYDFWEEEVHICAVKPSKLLTPSILYGNISNPKVFAKNSMATLCGAIKFLTGLR